MKLFNLIIKIAVVILSNSMAAQNKIESDTTKVISKVGSTANVMLNASADNGPRVVNIGLPASVGGTTIIDSSGKRARVGHMGNAAVCKIVYKEDKFTLESFGDMSYVEKGKISKRQY